MKDKLISAVMREFQSRSVKAQKKKWQGKAYSEEMSRRSKIKTAKNKESVAKDMGIT